MMAKMFVPETEIPKTMGVGARLEVPQADVNVIDAAARGTSEGLHLALNVLAMLISFIALVALVNALLGFAHCAAFSRSSDGRSLRWPGAWACRGATRQRLAISRHAYGPQRVHRLLAARADEGDARSEVASSSPHSRFADSPTSDRLASRSAVSGRWRPTVVTTWPVSVCGRCLRARWRISRRRRSRGSCSSPHPLCPRGRFL